MPRLRQALIFLYLIVDISTAFGQTINYQLRPIDERVIEITSLMYRYPLHLRYEDSNSLEFSGNKEAVLFRYDLISNQLDTTRYRRFNGKYYIYNWKHVNDSNDLISFSATYLGNRHDKSIVLYNTKKDSIISYYNFEGLDNIRTVCSEDTVNFSSSHFIYMHDFELSLNSDSSVVVGLGSNVRSNDPLYNSFSTSNLVKVYPNYQNRLAQDLNLKFENSDSTSFTFKEESLVAVQNGQDLVLSYGNSNQIFLLNLKTLNIKKIDAQPQFLPVTRGSTEKRTKELSNDFKYRGLYYDSLKHKYYRIVEFPSSPDIPISGSYPKHGVIIMNDSLMVAGWVELPFGYTSPIVPSPNGFLAFDKLNSEKKGTMILTEFTLEENGTIDSTPSTTYKELSNLDAQVYTTEKYLSELGVILDSNSQVIVIPIENSCPYNVRLIANALKNGLIDSSYSKIFLYDTKNRLDDFMIKYDLKPNDTYYFDSYKYKSYFSNLFNINIVKLKSGYWLMDRLDINELVDFVEQSRRENEKSK